tara:strand:- start:85 stop:948 length:864 start_codon:yes stop_codon:yes gene_type:complete
MRKLWVIGDSFADETQPTKFCSILSKNWKGKMFRYAHGGNDAQTILDTLLINLCNLNDGDLVIIYLPTLWRHRLPLQKKYWNNHKKLQGEFQHHWANGTYDEEWNESNVLNTFLTANGLVSENKEFLEPPFSLNNFKLKTSDENNLWNIFKDTNNINKGIDYIKLHQSNDSNVNRIERILKSVKDTFPKVSFEFFTWTRQTAQSELEYDESFIKGVDYIKKQIGIYETNDELYKATNGIEGCSGDVHFSPNTDKAFAKWIMKKYYDGFNKTKKYFNLEQDNWVTYEV